MAARERIDRLLVAQGLAESRTRAQALVLAGQVLVDGTRVDKPGTLVPCSATLQVKGRDHPFVSRGGAKLQGALVHFGARTLPPGLALRDRVAMDVGASTGGFTDCLLQRGAARVYAVDVGYGQMAWRIRQDPRVVVIERQNIRHLPEGLIPEPMQMAVIDVSFISLTLVLPSVLRLLAPAAWVVALIKPQFEVGKGQVGRGGIVRDDDQRHAVVEKIVTFAGDCGLKLVGTLDSPIVGQKGNREILAGWQWQSPQTGDAAPAHSSTIVS